jgi:hypothetical protein
MSIIVQMEATETMSVTLDSALTATVNMPAFATNNFSGRLVG